MSPVYSIPKVHNAGAPRLLRVFLCHCSEDKARVRALYNKLAADGLDPWLDTEKLVPGQDFDREIRNAVRSSDVVIVCLSSHSITKEGYVQKEIRFALDAAQEKPEGAIYIIPLRLEECRVPEQLGKLHWVNFYTHNGYRLLLDALQARATELEQLQNTILLREMLIAQHAQPAYIVASPKYPSSMREAFGQAYDHRTFGDNLGVRGLIHAFGSILGVSDVELISAKHAPPGLVKRSLNLYLIGSRKVNPVTKKVLSMLLLKCEPKWSFDPPRGESDRGNWRVILYRRTHRKLETFEGKFGRLPHTKAKINVLDYGLLVRSPHPYHRERLVLIAAGARSLGSGAACLAATRPRLIREIETHLPPGTLENKRSKFWALVQGRIGNVDTLLDEDGVHIIDAGVFKLKE